MTAGQTVHLRFNRKPTSHCADPLNKYPADKYSVWLYNNPVRNLDTINFDKRIQIASGISGSAGVVDVTIPKNLPQVKDGSLWYLRIDSSLPTAPQVCSDCSDAVGIFRANGCCSRCLPSTTLLDHLILLLDHLLLLLRLIWVGLWF